MKILGIETSCDETACSIVEDGRRVLANVIASQIDMHAKTGGVVPEVAAREHVLNMIPVLDECLEVAGCSWDDIDAVAVTRGPGLVSSLIIGTETASVISYVKNKPLVPAQHIIGHIYSNWIECEDEIEFPVLALTVSGGHNELILMRGHLDFEILGQTRDDAAGEAFDKVSRMLGLGYPGGPAISKNALKGNLDTFTFPISKIDGFDYSFSGLKTAVLTETKRVSKMDEQFKSDISACFQEAVAKALVQKLEKVLEAYPEIKEVHLAGGVSANLRLREVLAGRVGDKTFRHPSAIAYCTDNAAMIASAGYFVYAKSPKNYLPSTNITPNTSFTIV